MAKTAEHDDGRRRRPPWRLAPWGLAGLILLLPLLAMQFTSEVAWDAADFIVMGAMLFGACGVHELTVRMTGNIAYRAAAGVAVAAAFLLVWMNLAVGIIGSEDDPANLVFVGVLAVALAGSLVARFQSPGMAGAMAATALAQVLAGVFALFTGPATAAADWPWPLIVLTGIFAALWSFSAWLFKKASA